MIFMTKTYIHVCESEVCIIYAAYSVVSYMYICTYIRDLINFHI